MQKLVELYQQWSGAEPQHIERLPGAGSNRMYYRLTNGQGESVVGCVGTSRDENHAFVYLGRHFASRHLPVPEILAVSNDELRYIQSDLGSISLFDAISGGREAGGRYTLKEQELLKRIRYTIDGENVTIYDGEKLLTTITNTITDMGGFDDENPMWIGEQLYYNLSGDEPKLVFVPGVKFTTGLALLYDDMPDFSAPITIDENGNLTIHEITVIDSNAK